MSDLKARVEALLVPCGPHDYGMPEFGCSCRPEVDYRPVLSALLDAHDVHKAEAIRLAVLCEQLEADNLRLAGALTTVEEQLSAATLEGQP